MGRDYHSPCSCLSGTEVSLELGQGFFDAQLAVSQVGLDVLLGVPVLGARERGGRRRGDVADAGAIRVARPVPLLSTCIFTTKALKVNLLSLLPWPSRRWQCIYIPRKSEGGFQNLNESREMTTHTLCGRLAKAEWPCAGCPSHKQPPPPRGPETIWHKNVHSLSKLQVHELHELSKNPSRFSGGRLDVARNFWRV